MHCLSLSSVWKEVTSKDERENEDEDDDEDNNSCGEYHLSCLLTYRIPYTVYCIPYSA